MIACNPAGGAIGFDGFETLFLSIFIGIKFEKKNNLRDERHAPKHKGY